MKTFNAFIAGFISTLLFHQGLLAALHAADPNIPAPYDLTSVPPLDVPAVLSLAFWGGVWGIVLWQFMKNSGGAAYWLRAILIGAIGPSAVALFIVMPLKDLGMAMGWDPKVIVGALMLNGAWGLGVGILMKLLPGSSAKTPDQA